jgi:hypothetical protein
LCPRYVRKAGAAYGLRSGRNLSMAPWMRADFVRFRLWWLRIGSLRGPPPFNMPNESLVKRPEARLQDLLSRDLLRGALAALTQENVATRTPFLSEHALPQRPHAEVAGAGGHKPGVLRRRLTISGLVTCKRRALCPSPPRRICRDCRILFGVH